MQIVRIDEVLRGQGPAAPGGQALQRRPAAPAPVPISFRPELLPAGLPPSVTEAALMLTDAGRQVARQFSTQDLGVALLGAVKVVPLLMGHSKTLLEAKELAAMSTGLAEMVQRSFSMLTTGEIGIALRRGASGEWKADDEVELAALPTFRKWLKRYAEGSRAQAIAVLRRATEAEAQRRLPPPRLDYPREVAELAAWVSEQATPEHPAGRFPEPLDQGGVLYRWLQQVGAFTGFKTRPQYEAMWRKECLRRARLPPEGLQGYREGRRFWELLRAGRWHAEHPFADSVNNACRRRLLKEWILYHLGKGTDLPAYLQQLSTARQQAA